MPFPPIPLNQQNAIEPMQVDVCEENENDEEEPYIVETQLWIWNHTLLATKEWQSCLDLFTLRITVPQ